MRLLEDYAKSQSDLAKVRDVYCMLTGTGAGLERAADMVERVQTGTKRRLRDTCTYG